MGRPMLAHDAAGREDGRVVVLVHGWPLNRTIWSEVTPRLVASGIRVLAPDLPGFGESPPLPGPTPRVETYAAGLATFLEAVGPHRSAVAGHSFGGYVALALAEMRPDLVRGLGLIASRTGADNDTVRRGRLETIEKVRAGGAKVLLPGLAEKLVGARGAVAWRPRASRIIEQVRAESVIAGLAAMAARPDRTVVFDKFSGPRLVVHGSADALIPVAEAAQPSTGRPPIRAILPDVGHMPMWESPEATADAVVTWSKALRP